MSHRTKQYPREQKKPGNRKKDQHVLSNVVSLRISDQEKRILEKITKATSMNVSEIVREALDKWLAKRQRYCLDA